MDRFSDADPSSIDWEEMMDELGIDRFRPAHLQEAWDLILVPPEEDPEEQIRWLLSEYDPYYLICGLTSATCALTAFARAVGVDPKIMADKHLRVFRGEEDSPES